MRYGSKQKCCVLSVRQTLDYLKCPTLSKHKCLTLSLLLLVTLHREVMRIKSEQGMYTYVVRRPYYQLLYCNVCLLQGLIKRDILICTQLYHKVIIEYFPKTKQNIVKSPNCLLTAKVKIANLKASRRLSSLSKTSSLASWDEAHCNLSQSLIIPVISHPLLQEEKKTVKYNNEISTCMSADTRAEQ